MLADADPRASRFVLVLFLIACALVAVVLAPFAGAFFSAAVLAGVLHPVQASLSRRLGGHEHLAAGILTSALVLVVLIPAAIMGWMVIREGTEVADWVAQTYRREGVHGLLNALPKPLAKVGHDVADLLTEQETSNGLAAATAEGGEQEPTITGPETIGAAASAAGGVAARVGRLSVGLGVLIIATFFLISEGRRLVDYLVDLVPLPQHRTRAMLSSFREVSVGVFVSTLATSLIQTLAALVGYLIAGLPGMTLVLFATFVCSFIPAVGAAGVTVTAGLVLWMSGRATGGIFLTLWGLIVVSLIDNFVKPWLARDRVQLPTSVVFFAMVCGLAVFGVMGLVAGPLAIALFRVAAEMVRQERIGTAHATHE